ncbi:MAG TPA: sterol desaturase family protein, partial [Cryomorphaceae bacterium]|nr:sterol desaturase family protein [Cryomorphaceae bacterium]
MDVSPVILAIPVFFILIGMEVAYGYVKNRKLYRLNDAITNISCGIVEQLTGVFAKVFTVAAYAVVYENFRLFTLDDHWYWILLCFIGVDFFYYWAHRMSHEVNLFWLGHVVHHQSEDYNLSVALRQSTFQKMFTFYFYFPLAFLGFKTEWFLLMGAFNLLYQFWIHTEVIKNMPRWYEFLFNTPSHHRVHHGRNPKYIDRNHAATLMIWDRMFGTFQREEEKPTYGITSPLQTWNPVMANIQPFIQLWKELKRIPGWVNKLRFIFAKPGWYPEVAGGVKAPPEVDSKTYRKFDIDVSPALNFYLFVQYLLILTATALFLFNLSDFTVGIQLLIAALIILSVASLGTLFQSKTQALKLESMRFVFTFLVFC